MGNIKVVVKDNSIQGQSQLQSQWQYHVQSKAQNTGTGEGQHHDKAHCQGLG